MPMCLLLWNNLFCFPMELLFGQDLKDGEQNQEYQVSYVKAWIIYYFIVVLWAWMVVGRFKICRHKNSETWKLSHYIISGGLTKHLRTKSINLVLLRSLFGRMLVSSRSFTPMSIIDLQMAYTLAFNLFPSFYNPFFFGFFSLFLSCTLPI